MVAPTTGNPKTLLLVGATGLVGQAVLQRALGDPRVARIIAPTRRPLAPHPRLDNPIVDFDRLPADAPWWRVDGAICTLGTTIRQAGSREAFRQVDHDYPLAVARLLRAHGTTAFALNSSMGANPESGNFYLRTKGEVEVAIGACGFPSLTLVRPGLLGGRRAEFRLGERAALIALRVLGPLLPRRYRISPAGHVAAALLDAVIGAAPGRHVVESGALV
jgi:uncharacterized protein YbjT (DUF2867 family)